MSTTVKEHARLHTKQRTSLIENILQLNEDLRLYIPLLKSNHIKEHNLKRFEKRFEQAHFTLTRLKDLILQKFPFAKGRQREEKWDEYKRLNACQQRGVAWYNKTKEQHHKQQMIFMTDEETEEVSESPTPPLKLTKKKK